ncbi:MAG: translation initiation factor IF-2 [Cyclobacteriaceae bacterium]
MSAEKTMRLSQVARKLNVGTATITDHLAEIGIAIENKPNTKITKDQIDLLTKAFRKSVMDKEEAEEVTIGTKASSIILEAKKEAPKKETPKVEETITADKVQLQGIKVLGKIDLGGKKEEKPVAVATPEPTPKTEEPVAKKEAPTTVVEKETETKEEIKVQEAPTEKKEETVEAKAEKTEEKTKEASTDDSESKEVVEAKASKLQGLKVLGKIELPKQKESTSGDKKKRKRVRIEKPVNVKKDTEVRQRGTGPRGANAPGRPGGGGGNYSPGGKRGGKKPFNKDEKKEISQQEIQDKIKATMARMSGGNSGGRGNSGVNRAKYRKDKREAVAEADEKRKLEEMAEARILRVTEFISANDLASLMEISVNDVISMCMSLGMFVSINQRLDAETITIIAEEFGYQIEFTTQEDESDEDEEEVDDPKDLIERAPVVTIMGHVDHGKTSLLDYIREAKVADGEAGGITQHIGAYSVKTDDGKPISFLDTPGHEAFTAMRARGAKVTDIVVLVVAADDRVMPQTKEAINHAQVAGVPIIIAINKIDKPTANSDKIKEELSQENILVEDWGGKFQCQEVSAKSGQGIDELLDKILLEAEVMELKANPTKKPIGTIVEASLDKGRGYLSTMLVQGGTLKVGDVVVAGAYYGRVKAMTDHKGNLMKEAGPSMPLQLLGLNGAPQAGDKFRVVDSDKEAKEIATKRSQLLREQQVRTKKHLTLDEIGRRLAVGNFKELNLIIKGDVDGSVEALTDSLLKLSTEEVAVNVIHRAVGQITESDVLLATASDAIIIGFQVRPSPEAKRIAEGEEVEIRTYSIIYKAIEEMKDALEGLLDPEFEEVITGNIEIREIFKISKIGTIARCYVLDGTVHRSNDIRVIRDGVVVHSGAIDALKRFKDDVAEVKFGYECGLSIKNFNDIQVGDVIEAFEEREKKRKLK